MPVLCSSYFCLTVYIRSGSTPCRLPCSSFVCAVRLLFHTPASVPTGRHARARASNSILAASLLFTPLNAQGNPDDEIHYFSIVNSLMIVLFLTGVVAMIMLRTLRKDITTYNEMQTLEEAQEESGWKLVRLGQGRGGHV